MSEDAADLDDRPLSPATDPHGTAAAGDRPDSWNPAIPKQARGILNDDERAYHAQVFGVTYREKYGIEDDLCVAYCRAPGQKTRGIRCPACYGKVEIRPINQAEIDPAPTRAERFAAWVGGWVGAFIEAVMFPFRVGRAHTEAQIRDLLEQAMAAGLRAEIVAICPECGAQGREKTAGE